MQQRDLQPEDSMPEKVKQNVIIPKYMLAVLPIVSLLIGVGISYGIVKTNVSNNVRRLDVLERKVDLLMEVKTEVIEVKTDVKWIRDELLKQREKNTP